MHSKLLYINSLFFYILLLICQLSSAQEARHDIYSEAVDNINCKAIKLLLRGYDRPFTAKNIKYCAYNEIVGEVSKVQENQIKGYVDMFLALADNINSYKTRVPTDAAYDQYANSLEELSSYTVKQFTQICEAFRSPENTICVKLSQKALNLEADLNDVVSSTLAKINVADPSIMPVNANSEFATDDSEIEVTSSDETADTYNYEVETTANNTETTTTPTNSTSNSKGRGTSWWVILLLLGLLAAMIWLFKRNSELTEKVEDVEMLLKALTQKK